MMMILSTKMFAMQERWHRHPCSHVHFLTGAWLPEPFLQHRKPCALHAKTSFSEKTKFFEFVGNMGKGRNLQDG
ncbi:hypothetical protein Pint_32213 [Pistacia integerrima]|uniref:Uncharacterized protein n=1 Tax=Pistacia integerrima TaxID=434235 RepID=A0ACC0XLM6_9ROSI|nr:hypothetical protein Pint_32213 [Pistacia integerrima]